MPDTEFLRTLSVQEFLAQHPEAISIFVRYRLACVGCDLSQFHTIADVIAIYGLEGSNLLREILEIVQLEPTLIGETERKNL